MKKWLRDLTVRVMVWLARRRVLKMGAQIVGVTGSVGKTTAKEMIAAVLERRYSIKKSAGNMNSEIGLALTLFDEKSPYGSPMGWLGVLGRVLKKSFQPVPQYDFLVAEMGVDHPGDMDALLKVFHPNQMVFLNVKNVHLGEDQFKNRKAIFQEKVKACLAVDETGWLILNEDDSFIEAFSKESHGRTVGLSTKKTADLRAEAIKMSPKGIQFELHYEDQRVPVHLPHVLGVHHVELALAAIAVGFINEVPWKAIAHALGEFKLPPGRMNLIDGVNGSTIIDSTYNASPEAMEAALEVLGEFHGRKIAALGTMNELAELSSSAHIKMGKLAAEKADVLVAVGSMAHLYADGARHSGMSGSMIHIFKSSTEAGEFLERLLERGDVLLAKGSQNGVFMERLVKLCMKHPEQARHLLVRQDPYWLTQA